jgi:PAS domain S-box-containing protein
VVKELSYQELEVRVRGLEIALKENEEEWRSLLESAPDIILKADSDGKILFINRTVPGFCIEETIGRSVYEYIPPDYQDMTREAIKQVFKTGDSVSFETIAAGPGGVPSWYSTRLGPVKVWAKPGSRKGITVYISIPKYLQMGR